MLDTNICIYLMNKKSSSVIEKFKILRKGEVVISSIASGELYCGMDIKDSQAHIEALLSKIEPIPYDNKAAFLFGQLSRQFPGRKSSFDRMIAAHALSLNVVLVTNNVADFSAYADAGLRTENWVAHDR